MNDYILSLTGKKKIDAGSLLEFGVAREVLPHLDLGHCLSLASNWLKTCDEYHSGCAIGSTVTDTPSRLLDLGTTDNPDVVYLREIRNSTSGRVKYMTLSHCWGEKRILITTKSTFQDRMAGISVSQLPKTFQDAIKITRGLGMRYLWIDSLCIIQDDLSDWESESKKMASIYAGSQLNIAATQSADGDGGCFAERWTLDPLNRIDLPTESWFDVIPDDDYEGEPYFISVRPALHVAHDHFTRAADYVTSMIDVSPLLSRAWVFQERLLAPRTLHFHYEELIWECNTGISCECSRLTEYTLGDPDGALDSSTPDQLKTMYSAILRDSSASQVLDSWLDIVSDYCSLRLTVEKDRLPALAGLSSRVASKMPGSSYLAGLWSQDIPRSLCWIKESISQPSFRPPDSGVPSWSWASVWLDKNAIITVPHITYDPVRHEKLGFVVDSRFALLDITYPNTEKVNSFSVDACLVIQGALLPITYIGQRGEGPTRFQFGEHVVVIRPDCLGAFRVMADVAADDSFASLLIGRSIEPYSGLSDVERGIISYALILRKSRDKNKRDIYNRVGMMDPRGQEYLWRDASVVRIGIE